MNRDIVVIGASAGGIGPLCKIVKELPKDLPATVFVCLHVGAKSMLDEVLQACGKRTVLKAKDRQRYAVGMVYVAPPRVHLTIDAASMKLLHSPAENRHRPSVDVLFRSAAQCCGPRVIGIVLSGALDDGAAGLYAIKSQGGVAIVQEPKDATVADMPRAALRYTEVDHCAPAARIPNLIVEAMKTRSPKTERIRDERKRANSSQLLPFVCPDCDGPIFQHLEGRLLQFQCSIGHKFSPDSFTEGHRDALERALWIAIRTLENRGQIHRFLAERAKEAGDKRTSSKMLERAEKAERDMELIKEIIVRL